MMVLWNWRLSRAYGVVVFLSIGIVGTSFAKVSTLSLPFMLLYAFAALSVMNEIRRGERKGRVPRTTIRSSSSDITTLRSRSRSPGVRSSAFMGLGGALGEENSPLPSSSLSGVWISITSIGSDGVSGMPVNGLEKLRGVYF
ncbi:hypothetical protein EDD16DRAFT_1604296 [Pisolithus croceorrhizus]|nr:hypothetical protein EDD16DRAFT_1604296 [Pisolithus croceorrhizus]